MKRRGLWQWICISGVPWLIVSFVILMNSFYQVDTLSDFRELTFSDYELPALISFSFWLYVFAQNTNWLGTDKQIGLFTWLDRYEFGANPNSAAKRRAQYPQIPAEYLSSKPDGLVLAKKGKQYVRVKIGKGACLNLALIGAPGCGKSVLLLTSLLYQQNCSTAEDSWVTFALDIKPELRKKSAYPDNENVLSLSLTNRDAYGWNVYAELSDDSSDDDLISSLNVIAKALVDTTAKEHEFFYESARNIMIGVCFFMYKNGRSFMKSISYLMEENLETVVSDTIDKVDGKPEFRIVKKLLKPYAGKTGEAMEGIELAFRQSLAIFTRQDVCWFLDNNPKKTSSIDLENKKSIFFEIEETRVDEMKSLLRLVTSQVMHHCSGRSEDSHMIVLGIDEAARLGAINFTSFLATSRSRQISTILCFQSITQMQKVWGKEDAKSLIELCRINAILSCSDTETARMFADWSGTFLSEKRSSNYGGKNRGTYSKSFEEKKVLEPVDIMNLQEKNEVILFIKGKYMRADVSGARYFNIPELNKISKQCLAANSSERRRLICNDEK